MVGQASITVPLVLVRPSPIQNFCEIQTLLPYLSNDST